MKHGSSVGFGVGHGRGFTVCHPIPINAQEPCTGTLARATGTTQFGMRLPCIVAQRVTTLDRSCGKLAGMTWEVEFHPEFEPEFEKLSRHVRLKLLAAANYLAETGPNTGRPHVDTLKGSRYSNMKEIRFKADNSAWRVAFAFDPRRTAVILVAAQKSGTSGQRFYRQLINTADKRFGAHLKRLNQGRTAS